jgi:hypothetical protein
VAPKTEDSPDGAMRRLSNVIAVVAFKDQEPEDAALRLETLGFNAKEIGGILGKNENYLHMVKSARKSKKKSKKGKG